MTTTAITAAPSAHFPRRTRWTMSFICPACWERRQSSRSADKLQTCHQQAGRQAVTRAIKHFKEQPANLKWLNKAIKHRPFGDPLSNMIPSPTSYRMMTISWEKQQNRNNNNNTVYDTIDWVTLPSWSHSVCHPLLRKRGSK